MRHYNFALISESTHLSFSELPPVAAAISTQMIRDISPMWRCYATLTPFPSVKAAPVGYYKIIIQDNIHVSGASGFHTDDMGQPYSLIQYDSGWSVTASHEAAEMLVDPAAGRLYPGIIQGKRVQVLEEICDPCEAFTYTIDGITVSDFVTPEFYSAAPRASKTYSFLGNLTAPYQVADGGYISWLDPTSNRWFQLTNFGGIQISDLGPNSELTAGFKSLREAIDFHSAKNHPALGKVKLNHTSFAGPF
jgi:hypothetical protein